MIMPSQRASERARCEEENRTSSYGINLEKEALTFATAQKAMNPKHNQGRREWKDRRREEKQEKEGGVIRQVMTSGDSYSLLSICCGPTGQRVHWGRGQKLGLKGGKGGGTQRKYKWRGRPVFEGIVSVPGLCVGKHCDAIFLF